MKTFLKRFFGFVLLLILSNWILGFVLPTRPYYGNEMVEQKISSINNDFNKYDVLFLGSSRIVNGINPTLFDSIMQENNRDINSYNLGSYGTWFNENIFLITSLLNNQSIQNTTLIIEFQHVMSIPFKKVDNHKNIYYQNPENFLFIFNYVFDKDVKSLRDVLSGIHYLLSYSLSGTLNLLNLGKIKGLQAPSQKTKNFDDKGFFALEGAKSINSEIISNYHSDADQLFQPNKNNPNEAVIKKVHEIIERAQKKNISIIFILTPKNYTEEMIANYKALPSENKIDFRKFLNQSSLFKANNWGDDTHFNYKGAQKFTEFIAKEYLLLNETVNENK